MQRLPQLPNASHERLRTSTWYGSKRLSIACTASCTATWTSAESTAPIGPGRPAAIAVWAISFQSTTASPQAGPAAAADAALARLVALARQPQSDAGLHLSIAEIHAFRGDEEQALKWAGRALHHADNKWVRAEMGLSPFLRSLHSDARWHTLLARADAP